MAHSNTNMSKALLSATALSTVLISGGSAVLAQEDGQVVLEEIQVTATRRVTSVQDIPYNISAMSGADIDAAKMVDAAELLRAMAGIATADRGARNASQVNGIRIRGLNVDSAFRGDVPVTSGPTVATYINDTPIFSNMMLKDLNRVEVLRGPQGTLYGSGALGGAVRYITNQPNLEEFEGSVAGTISTTDGSGGLSWTTDLVLNIPVSDSFALRAVASHVDTAGIIDYVNIYELDGNGAPVVPGDVTDTDARYTSVKDADEAETDFLRVTALFKPSDAFDVSLSYTHQSDDVGARRGSAEGAVDGDGNVYGRYEAGAVQLEPAEADLEMFAAEVNVDMGFATLTSSTSVYDRDGRSISENTGFYAQKGWLANFYYNSPRPLARADRGFRDKAFIQEVRLVSNSDGPLNWVVGGYYQDQDLEADQVSTLAGYKAWASTVFGWMSDGYGYSDTDNDFDFDSLTRVKEKALYGEITYDVTDAFHVTGGIRYFDSSVSADARVDLPFWNSLFAPAEIVDQKSGKKDALFKLNLSYDMNDDTKLYATVSEGYRRGGATAVPTIGYFAEDPAWLSFGSDSVVNYEIGAKGVSDAFRYTVSAFYVDWTNPQINTATSNWGFFTVANGDKARSYGLEVELEGQATEALHYTVGYAYLNSKLSEDFLAPTGSVIAADGNSLPGVPKHMFSASADYTAEIGGYETIFRIDGYLQSKTKNYIDNDHPSFGQTHKGFALINAATTVRVSDVDITLFVKNLFNNRGVTARYSESYMGTDPAQNYFGSGAKAEITLPRTFGLAAKYSF
ncbi:TonB-dependent receptor [Kordiimonas sediminis]|uniref:TonB-dependent receptor n=1 Tax=Kordiimonas sediminis TaxID=1735581 RepID=A0A919AMF1_9PROT|nr:TonB-dependent receptor [Kordiimonas sediminis]GHF14831.1 TonB-dependent receptor [Kordiimonas sediminis]